MRSLSLGKTLLAFAEYILGSEDEWSVVWGSDEKEESKEEENTEELPKDIVRLPSS